MRLGISIASVQFTDDHVQGARNILERVSAANDAQLDSLTVGDRHAVPVPFYQNVPLIGRALADWDPDRPIGCLFLLPLWHPVLAAEQIATLACMTDARFVVQAGIGGDVRQFAAMGADLTTRGVVIDESIRVIKTLLDGERVSSERLGIVDAGIRPVPPRPVEWWVGGSVTAGLRRAATQGDAWYADAHLTADEAPARIEEYRALCAEAGRPGRAIVRKDVLILRDGHRAKTLGDEAVETDRRNIARSAVAYGSVDDVVEQLGVFRDLGFDDTIIRCLHADQAVALETIELASEVRQALA